MSGLSKALRGGLVVVALSGQAQADTVFVDWAIEDADRLETVTAMAVVESWVAAGKHDPVASYVAAQPDGIAVDYRSLQWGVESESTGKTDFVLSAGVLQAGVLQAGVIPPGKGETQSSTAVAGAYPFYQMVPMDTPDDRLVPLLVDAGSQFGLDKRIIKTGTMILPENVLAVKTDLFGQFLFE